MGKQRNTEVSILTLRRKVVVCLSLLIIPTVRFWKKAQAIEIIHSLNWAA